MNSVFPEAPFTAESRHAAPPSSVSVPSHAPVFATVKMSATLHQPLSA